MISAGAWRWTFGRSLQALVPSRARSPAPAASRARVSRGRLALRGVDVGERFDRVAQNWAPIAGAGNYAFNDMHAMMCFVGAGRLREQQEVIDAQRSAMEGDGDNADYTREVGHPATLAIQAFGRGRYAECVELLRPIRHIAHRFGGSHAQRDLLDQTLIEASRRAGLEALTTALVNERVALRPQTPLATLLHKGDARFARAA